ncbi:IME2-dependent-signaling protein [Monosporozyma unispora]|nr:hypothetical protein C6P44_000167 [Kazachstania unispora]
MSDFNFGGDELPDDLADAVRKSWSAPQETPFLQGQGFTSMHLTSGGHSPIGTPIISNTNLASMTNPDEVLPLSHKTESNNTMSMSGKRESSPETSVSNNSNSGNQQPQSDYQLFKHHYSISENARKSVSDILHELDIDTSRSTSPNRLTQTSNFIVPQHANEYMSQQQIFQQQQLRNPFSSGSGSNSSVNMMDVSGEPNSNPKSVLNADPDNNINPSSNYNNSSRLSNHMTTRRSSIQDVQWIRQLLNPRSSFSGPSQNEMSVNDPFLQRYNVGNTSSGGSPISIPEITKCWVTTLRDDSIEAVKSMIVLYYSLSLTNSKYPMYVLHDSKIDVSQLKRYNINTISIPTEYFQDDMCNSNPTLGDSSEYKSLLDKKWFLLSLFVSFIHSNYELVCYITPSSMIIDNIDELLDDPNINNEIDNETCVLLSNVTIDDSEEPQLIIFKPNKEVSMCIKEFFTLYGDNHEKLSKITKLLSITDSEVLKELFGETWGKISSEGYVNVLEPNEESLNINNFIDKDGSDVTISNAKILDFKKVKPWDMKLSNENTDGNVVSKWYQLWLEFWNTYHNI